MRFSRAETVSTCCCRPVARHPPQALWRDPQSPRRARKSVFYRFQPIKALLSRDKCLTCPGKVPATPEILASIEYAKGRALTFPPRSLHLPPHSLPPPTNSPPPLLSESSLARTVVMAASDSGHLSPYAPIASCISLHLKLQIISISKQLFRRLLSLRPTTSLPP